RDWIGERDRPGYRWRRKRIAGELLGASLFELPPGEKIAPYHYEDGQEEWLLVVSGEPTLRTPDGERVLEPGEVVCFPAGPAGAHQVTGPGRVLMASTQVVPRSAVQPDSDKVFVRWDTGPEDFLVFRRGDAVDYWEGENGSA
ncbi:MAG TPA: cupin domain-containing protein, partial [Gaiellaceae bacterium]|nr:cupin domain-containing protein [Gaiellaceae bacterium]